jgi:predicted HTH domain antitoxin
MCLLRGVYHGAGHQGAQAGSSDGLDGAYRGRGRIGANHEAVGPSGWPKLDFRDYTRRSVFEEQAMVRIAFDLHEGALSSFRQDPDTFTRELRVAAAVKWYEARRVSQGRAAEIAGLSRAEFIDALGRYGVSPFQQTADEILEDAEAAGRG